METTHTSLPDLPTPESESVYTTSPVDETRMKALEAKLDDVLFMLSSQSYRLQALTKKFDALCESKDTVIIEDKPVEARKKDYEVKFDHAKQNADNAVLERQRTNSSVSAPKLVQKRAMSFQRNPGDVKVNLNILVYIDSISIIDHKEQFPAVEYEYFSDLFRHVKKSTIEFWDSKGPLGPTTDEMDLDLKHWYFKMEEEIGGIAPHSRAPTKLTSDYRKDNDDNFKGWYWRNVLQGHQTEFEVSYHVHMKSGRYQAPLE